MSSGVPSVLLRSYCWALHSRASTIVGCWMSFIALFFRDLAWFSLQALLLLPIWWTSSSIPLGCSGLCLLLTLQVLFTIASLLSSLDPSCIGFLLCSFVHNMKALFISILKEDYTATGVFPVFFCGKSLRASSRAKAVFCVLLKNYFGALDRNVISSYVYWYL